MINITARMKYSKKLIKFIEDNKAQELASIHRLLIDLRNSGHIEYAGSESQLDQNGRNGALFKISLAIDKCEFLESDEVITYLRTALGSEWRNLINKIEKEKEPASNEAMVPVCLSAIEAKTVK
jgi:hypothetical protein